MNLKDEPISQPELSLAKGPLVGSYQAEYLLGEGKLPDLNANAAGGFESYLSHAEIPANSAFIIRLLSE
jgi:hypothetical protein